MKQQLLVSQQYFLSFVYSDTIRYRCLILVMMSVITACGGGGGSGSSSSNEVSPDDAGSEGGNNDTITNEVVAPKNILLIISDDQGLDASGQYSLSTDTPDTPMLESLATQGVTFDNAWATPACTTTRATIITGKYGINSEVTFVPAQLSTDHVTLQQYLKSNSLTSNYESAVFGKWHLGGGSPDSSHPSSVGVDYYAGSLRNIDDYYNWEVTINGDTESVSEYHTSFITDLAADWIADQTTPWFAWVAFQAPHSPYHLPPETLHDRDLSGTDSDIAANTREYYLAAIEAMDNEIARLIDSMDEDTKENTVIIFMGDNGTPAGVIDTSAYDRAHSKSTLYQGGVAVPLIISGAGVDRAGEREGALVTATDLHATIAELAGIDDSAIYDSNSFVGLLIDSDAASQSYVYTEFETGGVTGWTVRSDQYKLIEYDDGSQELYNIESDFSESDDLLMAPNATTDEQVSMLSTVADNIRGEGDEVPIDITNAILANTNANCSDYVENYNSAVMDINNGTAFAGELIISIVGNKCVFNTNAIPNHDFNDAGMSFPNDVSEQSDRYEVTTSPTAALNPTELSLYIDNAIMLNGVKVDLLAAGCFGVGDGKIGCGGGEDWRYDPMFANNGFNVDSHNAHSQTNGTYHYHGSPMALFDDEDNSQASPVIGFAADGYPIFGGYFNDGANVRKPLSSYRLRSGTRPTGANDPGGSYDGSFRDDYEYVENWGDLDECNGMTVNGVYGYYITDGYPYVLGCFMGTPDSSFNK